MGYFQHPSTRVHGGWKWQGTCLHSTWFCPPWRNIFCFSSGNGLFICSGCVMVQGLRTLRTTTSHWRCGDPCLSCPSPIFVGQEYMYSFSYQGLSPEWPFPDIGAHYWWWSDLEIEEENQSWRLSPVNAACTWSTTDVLSSPAYVLTRKGNPFHSLRPHGVLEVVWEHRQGQPPLPFLSGSTSTIVLVSLPRFAGPCWPRPVLSGAMTPASAKSLLSVPLGPLFKCTSRAAIVTWSGLTYKPPYSGPFTHCTSQIDHSRMIWYRWRFSSRKGSRVSPEQPLAVPLLSRIGRRCCEKKAAEFIPVETRIIWSSIEFTRQLKRFAQFLNLLSSILFLLTQMNRNIQELLSLRSSHLDLSSLVPVIGPRLPGCGIFWTCVVVRKGGSSITTIDGSDIKEFRFTMGTSLPAMSGVSAPPFCWRIIHRLILPKSGWQMPRCNSVGRRQDLPPRSPCKVHAVPEMMLPLPLKLRGTHCSS